MKYSFLLVIHIVICALSLTFTNPALGQFILTDNYTFSQFSQTYTPITGGTVRGTATNDDQLFSNIPIGFFIAYNGAQFNTIGISTNGFIWFGSTPPAGTNYNPISSTTASTAYICAFARNLESRSAAGGGELRTQLTGTSPNRRFTIQWKNYQRYTNGTADNGDIFNFQIRLFEYNQSIEIVYGSMTTTLNSTAQVGMRANVNTNFMNRVVNASNPWNNSIAGTTNTAAVSYTTTRLPASGQTYRWIPTSLVSNNLSGGDVDTVDNHQTELVFSNTALTATFVDEGGITSLGIQRFVNGVSIPWVEMNKLSGDDTSGTWQVVLPNINEIADVVYLYRIINPQGFFMYSGIIAYEVGYLRAYAPDDLLVPDISQGSGIPLSVSSSVSAVKITEVIFDRLAAGGNSGSPAYVPGGDIDLIELTNLSSESVELDGMILRVDNGNSQHGVIFPSGTVLPGGGRMLVQPGGVAGQIPTGIADELYFETGGPSNTLQSNTPFGISLVNDHNDVLDAVAFNSYQFSQASGVRIVHWYGDMASSAGKAGARRLTMTDHNTSTDWEFLDGSAVAGPGVMNPGLAAISTSPSYSWSSDDIPGWNPTGTDVQLPLLSNGTYTIKARCTDNGNFADDFVTVTVYTQMAPVADFVASEVTVYPDHMVQLTDLSANYPEIYSWTIQPSTFSFVNGTSATSPSPQIEFNAAGLYSVALEVTNALGNSTLTKNDYINVNSFLGVCVKPTPINVSDINSNSAIVSWSEGFVADSMEVRFAQNPGGGNGTPVYTTSSSASLSGLLAATNYSVRVRAWCNGMPSGGFTPKTYFTTGGARFGLEISAAEETSFNASVFPNPSQGYFEIEITNNDSQYIQLSIMDMAGKLIAEEKFTSNEGDIVLKPVTKLLPGMYLLRIITDKEDKVVRLVVL